MTAAAKPKLKAGDYVVKEVAQPGWRPETEGGDTQEVTLEAGESKTVEFTRNQTKPVSFVTVGRKGRDFMLRYGFNVQAEFTGIPDRPALLARAWARVREEVEAGLDLQVAALGGSDGPETLGQGPLPVLDAGPQGCGFAFFGGNQGR